MDINPYRTPQSDILIESTFKRSILWKFYFLFLIVATAPEVMKFLFESVTRSTEYIKLILWFLATIGLFGFTFVKPILKPIFWLLVFIAFLFFNLAYSYINFRMGVSNIELFINNGIGWLLSIPAYYGLFAFSKPTDPAWKKA